MDEKPERRSRLKRFFKDWSQHILTTGAILTMLGGGCQALGYEFPLVLRIEYNTTVTEIRDTLEVVLRTQLEQQEIFLLSSLNYIEAELLKNPSSSLLLQQKLETSQKLMRVQAKLRALEQK